MSGKDVLEQIFDTSAEESEKYQILKTFYESIGIEMKTDLKNREVDAIVKTEFFPADPARQICKIKRF